MTTGCNNNSIKVRKKSRKRPTMRTGERKSVRVKRGGEEGKRNS